MNHLKNFENKGINDTIYYFSIMFKKLYETLEKNENTITYDLEGNDFSIKKFTVVFNKSDEDHGFFIPKGIDDVKNNTLYDCTFVISFTNINNIIELSSHELNHAYEYIKLHTKIENFDWEQISEIRKPLSFKINLSIDKLLKEFDINNTYFDKFILLVKNTFNNEYNARITQLHPYLLKFVPYLDDRDKLNEPIEELLKRKIYDSKTYKMYERINEYIDFNLYEKMKVQLGEESLLKLTNYFNSELIKNKVNNINGYEFIKLLKENELENYYNTWNKLFKYKNEKHLIKMFKIIPEVIKVKNLNFKDALEHHMFYMSLYNTTEYRDTKKYFENKKNLIFDYKEFEHFKINQNRIKKLNRIL